MEILLFFGYLGLCLLVATLGRNTRIGYWGTVLVSVIITPFLTFLLLFFFTPRVASRQP
jgi:VanZ family protein